MPGDVNTTRNVDVTWESIVTKADPNWRRDHRLQVEDERRPRVLQDWQTRGPYTP